MNFSTEMETGTGKTYVYLRTIYELNKTYGFKKFVIVVPSVAIREGVLKNIELTREHLRAIYGNVPRRLLGLRLQASVAAARLRQLESASDSHHQHRRLQQRPERHPPGERQAIGPQAYRILAGHQPDRHR